MLLPAEVVALLRVPSAAREAWDELLVLLRSSGAEQKQVWWLAGGDGFFGWCSEVPRLLGWSVALRAEGTPLVAW